MSALNIVVVIQNIQIISTLSIIYLVRVCLSVSQYVFDLSVIFIFSSLIFFLSLSLSLSLIFTTLPPTTTKTKRISYLTIVRQCHYHYHLPFHLHLCLHISITMGRLVRLSHLALLCFCLGVTFESACKRCETLPRRSLNSVRRY